MADDDAKNGGASEAARRRRVPPPTIDLQATDVDNSPDQLSFSVTGATRGHVALTSNLTTTITSSMCWSTPGM